MIHPDEHFFHKHGSPLELGQLTATRRKAHLFEIHTRNCIKTNESQTAPRMTIYEIWTDLLLRSTVLSLFTYPTHGLEFVHLSGITWKRITLEIVSNWNIDWSSKVKFYISWRMTQRE